MGPGGSSLPVFSRVFQPFWSIALQRWVHVSMNRSLLVVYSFRMLYSVFWLFYPYLCGMENKAAVRAFLPITIIFLVTNAFFIVGRSQLVKWGVDPDLLIMGNLLLIVLTVFSFYQHIRALRNKNIHAFLRVLKGSMLIKMMVCGIAAFIYITTAGKAVNTGGVLGFMILYFVYTLTEAAIVMKLSKQNKNA